MKAGLRIKSGSDKKIVYFQLFSIISSQMNPIQTYQNRKKQWRGTCSSVHRNIMIHCDENKTSAFKKRYYYYYDFDTVRITEINERGKQTNTSKPEVDLIFSVNIQLAIIIFSKENTTRFPFLWKKFDLKSMFPPIRCPWLKTHKYYVIVNE